MIKSVQFRENPSPSEAAGFNISLDKNIARLLKLRGIVVPVAMNHFEEEWSFQRRGIETNSRMPLEFEGEFVQPLQTSGIQRIQFFHKLSRLSVQ